MADIQQYLSDISHQQDPEVEVRLRRNSLGWVSLRVVTDCFADSFPEREALIDAILEPYGLSLASYPFYDYELLVKRLVAQAASL